MAKLSPAFAVSLVLAALCSAQTEPLPFSLPIPERWRTETIPFPLQFAPDLPYTGLEELRFAPGMFEDGSEEMWTYAFVWWVGLDEPNDAQSLSTHLEAYFRGLAVAVAESRDFTVGDDAGFSASLEAGEGDTFRGVAETFDAFVTRRQLQLNVRGQMTSCPDQNHQAIFFALSPQSAEHAVWKQLDEILAGFRCTASKR